MSLLLIIGFVALWASLVLALVLRVGCTIARRSYRVALRMALFLAVFLAPLADELVALPQLNALCKGSGRFEYGPGMDQVTAFGRTVYYRARAAERLETLFPDVQVRLSFHDYVDAHSGAVVLRYRSVRPLESMFGYPDARGHRHPWLLHECWGARLSAQPDERALGLTVVRGPPLPPGRPRGAGM